MKTTMDSEDVAVLPAEKAVVITEAVAEEAQPKAVPETKKFAEGICYSKLFWVFLIGCVGGVLVEMFWCVLTRYPLENRSGLIYGPFNPVYGFGAVLLTVALYKIKSKTLVFICGAVIGGAFEYLCSLFQELAFHSVSWEYSETPANLHGRTNIAFSIMWGILALIWIKSVYPCLSRWIERIPQKTGTVLTISLTLFMCFNMLVSAAAVARQAQRLEGVPATSAITQFLDRHYPDERLKEVYPNMRFIANDKKPITIENPDKNN